jgi:hypothetical protein
MNDRERLAPIRKVCLHRLKELDDTGYSSVTLRDILTISSDYTSGYIYNNISKKYKNLKGGD